MNQEEPTTDEVRANRERLRRNAESEAALRELAACVKHYRKQNDDFARALSERHARWAARGLLK